MLCRKPFMRGVLPFGCGQCLPCLINRRRIWANRMMLEGVKHASSVFVSLTYASEHLPVDATLRPRDVQLWLKRLRKEVGALRFFLVGEYGTFNLRPHYHAILFGMETMQCVVCKNEWWRLRKNPRCDCVIYRTWGLGGVHVGEFNAKTADYIGGYIAKKFGSKKDKRLDKSSCRYQRTCTNKWCSRKNVMEPEFARMSLKPGIGRDAMKDVAQVCTTDFGAELILKNGDVPMSLVQGRKQLALGRYLRQKLREDVGLDEEKTKAHRLKQWSLEMVETFSALLGDSGDCNKSLASLLSESTEQRAVNKCARIKNRTSQRSL